MSVIAKMRVFPEPRAFGRRKLVELQCVCADELMPGCSPAAKGHENLSFQNASPSGDAKLQFETDTAFRREEELYLIFVRDREAPAFEGSIAKVEARCIAVTDYGGTSKRVEVSNVYRYGADPLGPEFVTSFSLVMSIDNPHASVQFEPGKGGYWIGIYRASDMTMTEALALAHAL